MTSDAGRSSDASAPHSRDAGHCATGSGRTATGVAGDNSSTASALRALFAQPVLAPLLRHRTLSIVLGAAGAIQVIAPLLGFVTFLCPFASVLKVPCPGCGISRACAAMIHADLASSIHWHAFALPFLVAVVIFLISIPLGARSRARLADVIENFERKSAISTMLLTGLMLYWVARLIYLHGHYGELVMASPALHTH